MGFILLILIVILVLCFIILVRNDIIYAIRGRRLGEISDCANKLIIEGIEWRKLYEDFERGPSYEELLYNPFNWTYKQAYPNPVNKTNIDS